MDSDCVIRQLSANVRYNRSKLGFDSIASPDRVARSLDLVPSKLPSRPTTRPRRAGAGATSTLRPYGPTGPMKTLDPSDVVTRTPTEPLAVSPVSIRAPWGSVEEPEMGVGAPFSVRTRLRPATWAPTRSPLTSMTAATFTLTSREPGNGAWRVCTWKS